MKAERRLLLLRDLGKAAPLASMLLLAFMAGYWWHAFRLVSLLLIAILTVVGILVG